MRHPYVTYYKRGTANTIDDVTGQKLKLCDAQRRWDGAIVGKENYEERQPQDFPVTPRPQAVYIDSRPEGGNWGTVTAYNPSDGYEDYS